MRNNKRLGLNRHGFDHRDRMTGRAPGLNPIMPASQETAARAAVGLDFRRRRVAADATLSLNRNGKGLESVGLIGRANADATVAGRRLGRARGEHSGGQEN